MTDPESADVTELLIGSTRTVLAHVTTVRGASRVAARLHARSAEVRHVGIVSADLGNDIELIMREVTSVVAEIVCFDAITTAASGHDLATRALDEFGFGQDYVFTAASVEDAIDCGADMLAFADSYDGAALLILGPLAVLDRARRHLHGV